MNTFVLPPTTEGLASKERRDGQVSVNVWDAIRIKGGGSLLSNGPFSVRDCGAISEGLPTPSRLYVFACYLTKCERFLSSLSP